MTAIDGETPDNSPILEQLLQSYETGEVVASDQSFTLAGEDLGERYRTFQEQNESYYLLRLLQGLFRIGAAKIEIKTNRTTIHVVVPHFSESPPDWLNPSILVERLRQPHLWSRALHSICVGILCTRTESFEEFQWSFSGRQLRVSACPSSDYRVLKGDPSSSKLEILIKKKRVFIFSSTTQEHAELATRLGASRSPVVLDKLPLRLQKPEVKTGVEDWYSDFTAPFHLAEVEAGLQKPKKWKEWSDGFGTLSTPESWAAFKWFCDPDGPFFRLLLSLSLEGKGVVFPVIDGVLSKSLEVATLKGTVAYVDAQELDTDLSGLEVIDPSPLIDRIYPWYDSLLQRVRDHSDKLEPAWDSTYPSYSVSLNLVSESSPRSLLGLLTLTGALMVAEAAASRMFFGLRKKALRAKLRKALEERIEETLRERTLENKHN